MGIGQIAPTGASAVPPAEAESPLIDERAAGEHGPPSERLGTSMSDSGDVRARQRANGANADPTLTPEDEELRAWLVDADRHGHGSRPAWRRASALAR
jgi:hypothetical protein